jgi:predicted nucleic acid-binding protein
LSQKIRIVNTAPLIFLAKLRRLDLLRIGVDVVYVPTMVLHELRMVEDEAVSAVQSILGTWLIEKACTQPNLVMLASQALDPGEAEVIALALELETQDIVLDDLDARRYARRSGLKPIGTLGLLLAAKRIGLITAIKPEVEALNKAGFYASQPLIAEILKEAGEG